MMASFKITVEQLHYPRSWDSLRPIQPHWLQADLVWFDGPFNRRGWKLLTVNHFGPAFEFLNSVEKFRHNISLKKGLS
jgi:hypothetical protein